MSEQKITVHRLYCDVKSVEMTIAGETAADMLTAKFQRMITSAELKNGSAVITRHIIKCPNCSVEIPAYKEYLRGGLFSDVTVRPREFIERWTSSQTSLFDDLPSCLSFNTPFKEFRNFDCPCCRKRLYRDDGGMEITVDSCRRKIKLTLKLRLNDLLAIEWLGKCISVDSPNIYETVIFNLKKGRVYVSVQDEKGKKYAVRDISNANTDKWESDPIIHLINGNRTVRFELERRFTDICKSPFPFPQDKLTMKKFILAARFIGYDADFFDFLPLSLDGVIIAEGFKKECKRLHMAKNVPELFIKTDVPHTKSIKRIFYKFPALLFYKKETETFWKLIKNVDLFRKFLNSYNVFDVLLYLRQRPSAEMFYGDYKDAFGITSLLNLILSSQMELKNYISDYVVLNDFERKKERKRWRGFASKHKRYLLCDRPGESVSVPILQTSNGTALPDCTVNGYSFEFLKNSYEYLKAGDELHNCLGRDWEIFGGSVCVIKKNDTYVGAVELRGKTVVQAVLYANRPMKNDEQIYSAYKNWKMNNGLKEQCDRYCFFDR